METLLSHKLNYFIQSAKRNHYTNALAFSCACARGFIRETLSGVQFFSTLCFAATVHLSIHALNSSSVKAAS